MNSEIKFKNLEELYARILPALKSKVKELHKNGFSYIHESDIWNYLKTYTWVSSKDLDLAEMVNDIFLVNINSLDQYVKEQIKDTRREILQEE